MVCGSLFGGLMLSVTGFTAAFVGAAAIELVTLGINLLLIRRSNAGGAGFRTKEKVLV